MFRAPYSLFAFVVIFPPDPMTHVYRHLYPQVYDWDNLLQAWRKAL